MSVEDAARFDNSPCFICGYSGEQYYQPVIHKCAAAFHAHHSDKSCEQALRERLRDTAAALDGMLFAMAGMPDDRIKGEYADEISAARAILKRLKEEGLV